MEFRFLYWLQELHTPVMDEVMTAITFLGRRRLVLDWFGRPAGSIAKDQKDRGGSFDFPGSRIPDRKPGYLKIWLPDSGRAGCDSAMPLFD